MNHLTHSTITTESGERFVVVPAAEFQAMQDALDGLAVRRIGAALEHGQEELLSSDEMDQLLDASSPLAFWRKKRGLTQKALADQVGTAQSFIAALEKGRAQGDPRLLLRIARVLGVGMESLVVE